MLKRSGHDFTRNREGGLFIPWAIGEKPCVKRKHPKTYAHYFMHSCFISPDVFPELRGCFDHDPSFTGGCCSFRRIMLVILPDRIDATRVSRCFYAFLQVFFLFQDPVCGVAVLSWTTWCYETMLVCVSEWSLCCCVSLWLLCVHLVWSLIWFGSGKCGLN